MDASNIRPLGQELKGQCPQSSEFSLGAGAEPPVTWPIDGRRRQSSCHLAPWGCGVVFLGWVPWGRRMQGTCPHCSSGVLLPAPAPLSLPVLLAMSFKCLTCNLDSFPSPLLMRGSPEVSRTRAGTWQGFEQDWGSPGSSEGRASGHRMATLRLAHRQG